MKKIFYLLAVVLLSAAWLLPFHKTPWTTFGSEMLTFSACIALLVACSFDQFKIAKPQWLAALIILIPTVQYATGHILYFSNAMLCVGYLLMFWLMISAGYNLSEHQGRIRVFRLFCTLLIVIGVLSSVMAIIQWLQLSPKLYPYLNTLRGNRPYANFAQPNNFATFMSMGLIGVLYFYEKRIASKYVLIPLALLFIFTIALTQSRTSWVLCLFILIYLGIKQYNRPKRFGFAKLLLWVGVFILAISALPYINQWVGALTDRPIVDTASVVERASGGYLRLDMWNQALVAIGQQPWFGYGWNQTGMAQIAAFDAYPSHEWYKSAHNVILDLLIWNGIPIGLLIVLYVVGWLYWLNKGVRDIESIMATLMVCAILIHALLEFPIHYAYFLMPMGFLLGLIQSQYKDLPYIVLKPVMIYSVSVTGLVISGWVCYDYDLYKSRSIEANKTTPLTVEEQKILNQKMWMLSQFDERVWWVSLKPASKLSDEQLTHLGRMVANHASAFDVEKYAKVLAFNGKKAEAEHQLWILKTLHRKTVQYADLLPISSVASSQAK